MAQPSLFSYFTPKSTSIGSASILRHTTPSQAQEIPLRSSSDSGTVLRAFEDDSNPTSNIHDQAHTLNPLPTVRSLNPHVQISQIQSCHVDSLKRLTAATLPVRYPDKFFNEIVLDPQAADLSRVVLYDEQPVGWIRCHSESIDGPRANKVTNQIYVQALCVLAPYRKCGFATHLLGCVLVAETVTKYNAVFVYAHVWENNEDALEWYEKRGFQRTMLVDQYYRRLKPSGAWIVRMELR